MSSTYTCQCCGQEHPYVHHYADGSYPLDIMNREREGWEWIAPIRKEMCFELFGISCPHQRDWVSSGVVPNKDYIVYGQADRKTYAVYNHDGNFMIIATSNPVVYDRWRDRCQESATELNGWSHRFRKF